MRPIVDIKVVGTDCSNGMKLLKNLSKVEREIDLKLNIEKIEKNAGSLGNVSKLFEKGLSNKEIADIALDGIEYDVFDELDVEYKCTCSRERMKNALLSLKEDAVYEMLREQVREGKPEELDICCRFCNTHYVFTKDEIDKAFGK